MTIPAPAIRWFAVCLRRFRRMGIGHVKNENGGPKHFTRFWICQFASMTSRDLWTVRRLRLHSHHPTHRIEFGPDHAIATDRRCELHRRVFHPLLWDTIAGRPVAMTVEVAARE